MPHWNARAAIASSTMKQFRANRARDAYRSEVSDSVAAGAPVPPAKMDAYVCALLLSRTEPNRSVVLTRQAETQVHASVSGGREDDAGRVTREPIDDFVGASATQLHHDKGNTQSLINGRNSLITACEHSGRHLRETMVLDTEMTNPAASELATT